MKQNRSRSPHVVVVLILLVVWAASGPAQAQLGRKRVGQRPGQIRIAVFPIINDADADGGLVKEANDRLLSALEAVSHFLVSTVSASRVSGAMERVRIAREANAHWAVVVRLTKANMASGDDSGSAHVIEMYGEAWSTDSGMLAARTYAEERSDRKPKGKRIKGKIPDTRNELQRAVDETADQLAEVSLLQGIVVSRPEGGFVRISLGNLDHLRNYAEVRFGAPDDVIGYGDVIEVDHGQALVKVRPRYAYPRLILNTPTNVVYNPPPYAAGLTLKQITDRENRRDEIEFGAALVIAILGIFVFKPIIDRNLFP